MTKLWKPQYDKALATRASSLPRRTKTLGRGHPTTANVEYSESEMEFMMAMQKFKKETGRPFPTWSETLHVLKDLGYKRDKDAQ